VEVRLDGRGEIILRGPSVFRGYRGRPDATAEALAPDGWSRTGDVGAFDDDGYLRIVGRGKELIISGGYNVCPKEVEDVLRRHPQVNEVPAAGISSAEWGETVAAWIVPRGDIDEQDRIEFAASNLTAYNRPRLLEIVDELPRNSLGKVLKHQLPVP
jgi:malonyl-CoA/methylmalonyl-CoA synthetase